MCVQSLASLKTPANLMRPHHFLSGTGGCLLGEQELDLLPHGGFLTRLAQRPSRLILLEIQTLHRGATPHYRR